MKWTPEQEATARTVARVLRALRWSDRAIAAALVNAYAESLLDPSAVGDSGHSVGLFQLNDQGAGEGMSADERKDPVLCTCRIAQEATDRQYPTRAVNLTVDFLTVCFCVGVERPRNAQQEGARRAVAYSWVREEALALLGFDDGATHDA